MMRPAFRLDDRVQTCDWDADDQCYVYGPPGVIIHVPEPSADEPVYRVRNEQNGRICHRYQWELVRVPESGPMPTAR